MVFVVVVVESSQPGGSSLPSIQSYQIKINEIRVKFKINFCNEWQHYQVIHHKNIDFRCIRDYYIQTYFLGTLYMKSNSFHLHQDYSLSGKRTTENIYSMFYSVLSADSHLFVIELFTYVEIAQPGLWNATARFGTTIHCFITFSHFAMFAFVRSILWI